MAPGVTMNDQNDLKTLRHSAAHLAAHAILELFPGTKLTIGPATEEGFFYDILPVHNLKEEDLALIEKRMHEISEKNYPLEHKEISKTEARELFKDNPFKMELLEQIPGETAGLSVQGDFKIKTQKEDLEKKFPTLQFVLWDERLTSQRASEIRSAKSREEKIRSHSLAAAFILDSYITYLFAHAQKD
jgi:threonyl-tRNA synthetase